VQDFRFFSTFVPDLLKDLSETLGELTGGEKALLPLGISR